MKKVIISIFLVLSIGSLAAQSSISQYLDDGGRAKATDVLKTDPVAIYQGTVPFIWEHLFGDYFSLEMGAGVVLPFYNRPLLHFGGGENSLTSPHWGGSVYLSPKYIFGQGSLDAFYAAIPLPLRWYPGQLALFDPALVFGRQWLFNSRLTIDVSIGFGVECQFSLDKKSYVFSAEDRVSPPPKTPGFEVDLPEEYPDVPHFIIPFSIKLGYRL